MLISILFSLFFFFFWLYGQSRRRKKRRIRGRRRRRWEWGVVKTSVVSQLPICGQFEMLTSAFFHVHYNAVQSPETSFRLLYLSQCSCGWKDLVTSEVVWANVCDQKIKSPMSPKRSNRKKVKAIIYLHWN